MDRKGICQASRDQISYVFPKGSLRAAAFAMKIAQSGERYQLTVLDGYEIYQLRVT